MILDKLAAIWMGFMKTLFVLTVITMVVGAAAAVLYMAWLGIFSSEANWISRPVTIFGLLLIFGAPFTFWAEDRLYEKRHRETLERKLQRWNSKEST